jgi:hypothetical protein
MVLLRGLLGAKASFVPTVLNIAQCLGWAPTIRGTPGRRARRSRADSSVTEPPRSLACCWVSSRSARCSRIRTRCSTCFSRCRWARRPSRCWCCGRPIRASPTSTPPRSRSRTWRRAGTAGS